MQEEESKISRSISRRNFLKGTAALALALSIPSVFPSESRGVSSEIEPSRIYQPGEVVRRGDKAAKRIFLTIDDGGSLERVSQAALFAENQGVRLTFFPTGLNVAKGKNVWAQVIARGHAVENHTWNHQNLRDLSRVQVKDELVKQRDAVREAARLAGIDNYPQVFLRPPYGAGRLDTEVVSVCKELGYVIAMWSSDPQGWRKTVDTDMIVQRATADFANGIILLQHTNVDDMNALPRIITAAKARGFAMDKTLRDGIKTTVYPV